METHFLMSTIQRIGNLLRVGFGSAGAEIIWDNLERGRNEDVLFLNKKGGTVSCIFLFCWELSQGARCSCGYYSKRE
jgi:hypothetical protein